MFVMTIEENNIYWENYFIEGTNVLKNNLGISNRDELLKKEVEITAQKLFQLYMEPIDLGFGIEHLKAIHTYLFEDIYPFAGEYRNVYMEKNNSYFTPVDDIDDRLREIFDMMDSELPKVGSMYSFACFLAEYYVLLLNVHPFREGNGRSIREFIREYANEKSKILSIGPINFSWSNVDGDVINSIINKSLAYRSIIENEFFKALQPIDENRNLRK